MGGQGSGYRYRWDRRDTTEDYKSLTIGSFYRAGYLKPGQRGTTRWYRGETTTGSLSWWTVGSMEQPAALALRYTVNDEWVRYDVPLEWTPCHFGGFRPWFRCPAVGCGRRVGVLYGGRYFVCRHCRQLAYPSTRENALDRVRRKSDKIRERLGGSSQLFEPFPGKPKGMHWATYTPLEHAGLALERARGQLFDAWLDRMEASQTAPRDVAPPADPVPWETLTPIERAARLCFEDRLRDEEIAAELGISRRTLARWKHRPDFAAAFEAEDAAWWDRYRLRHPWLGTAAQLDGDNPESEG